jgi:hypothetical protein
MKIKTFVKKLGLNKETIANLDSIQMKDVMAGAAPAETDMTQCQSVCITHCNGCATHNTACAA